MAKITFITQNDDKITLEGTCGSVMELAVANAVSGIDGDCGGVCSCATCHVHVEPSFFGRLADAADIEMDMLELDDNVSKYSRLSCQLPISEQLDGITLKVAN